MKANNKLKKFDKKKLIIGGSAVGVVAIAGITYGVLHDGDNFYSKYDAQTQSQIGNFRYVFDVRTEKHTDKQLNLEDYTDGTETRKETKTADGLDDLKNLEGEGVEKTDSGTSSTTSSTSAELNENKFTDWGTANGAGSAGGWEYPNYTITVDGRVDSVEPYVAKATVKITTDKTSGDFFDFIAVDDKVYINLGQAKEWLKKSQDNYLISFSDDIPDNITYLELDANKDVSIRSIFAEDGDKNAEITGMSNVSKYNAMSWYYLSQIMQTSFGNTGLNKTNDRYRVDLSGDNARNAVRSIQYAMGNSGSYYDNFLSGLKSNEIITDKEYKQRLKYTSGVSYLLAPMWQDLTSCASDDDFESLNFQLSGWSRKFDDKADGTYESNLGIGYTLNDVDHVITFYASTSPLAGNETAISAPQSGVSSKDRAGSYDFSNHLTKMFGYLNPLPMNVDARTAGTSGADNVLWQYKDALIRDLNKLGEGNSKYTKQTRATIDEFISGYSNLDILKDTQSDVGLKIFQRVQQYKEDVKTLFGDSDGTGISLRNMSAAKAEIGDKDMCYSVKPLTVTYSDGGTVPVMLYAVTMKNDSSSIYTFKNTSMKWTATLGDGSKVSSFVNDVETLKELMPNVYEAGISTLEDVDANSSKTFVVAIPVIEAGATGISSISLSADGYDFDKSVFKNDSKSANLGTTGSEDKTESKDDKTSSTDSKSSDDSGTMIDLSDLFTDEDLVTSSKK